MIPSAIQKATVETPVRTIHCRREGEIDVLSWIDCDEAGTVWQELSCCSSGETARLPPARYAAPSESWQCPRC